MPAPSESACIVCGARDWRPLPDLVPRQSVTTAGRILPEPLGKAHCRGCGLLQRLLPSMAGTDHYEKHYGFYERPGAERFDRARYRAMAGWIEGVLQARPARVLDAGCGRGWMLDAMSRVYPHAAFAGIEPSEAESANARRRGWNVTAGRADRANDAGEPFDLVYSTNVLEHTDSPVEFLAALKTRLAPDGQIVITCPDASQPNAEMLFSDQNFSFLPRHLDALARRAGLEVISWSGPPAEISLRDKQLVVMRPTRVASRDVQPCRDASACDELYDRRRQYLDGWRRCGEVLQQACEGARRVLNFGTSTWSFLLAGYCLAYWSRVSACIIDGGSGEFLGKPVLDCGAAAPVPEDVVVLGVDPESQPRFAARFAGRAAQVVAWNACVVR